LKILILKSYTLRFLISDLINRIFFSDCMNSSFFNIMSPLLSIVLILFYNSLLSRLTKLFTLFLLIKIIIIIDCLIDNLIRWLLNFIKIIFIYLRHQITLIFQCKIYCLVQIILLRSLTQTNIILFILSHLTHCQEHGFNIFFFIFIIIFYIIMLKYTRMLFKKFF
jgi:hypothetical protein